jgi:hypothetical protein
MTKQLTESVIDAEFKSMWTQAESQHGKFRIPKEVSSHIDECLRAMHVLHLWKRNGAQGSPVKFLASYSVQPAPAIWAVNEFCGIQIESEEELSEVKTEKRANKWDSFLKWANEHHFEQFTTEELTEQSGFSYQTTLNYLQESPTFRKVKKGLWEVRDAKADKKAGI